jgi:2-iminobutanoate/2-iminopropanoate deaminase
MDGDDPSRRPKPVGPYSPAVRIGPWVFISGQIALDENGNLVRTTLEAEINQVLKNLRAILNAASLSPSNLVKVTIFLTDMAFFPIVSAAYEKLFPNGQYPARETVAVVALPRGARIEISAIAYDPRG